MAKHIAESWYGKKQSSGQGLIYSEKDGRNIAVCYDGDHAKVIAAAPELLAALKIAWSYMPKNSESEYEQVRQAIAKAQGH